jgi:hypothetical protein
MKKTPFTYFEIITELWSLLKERSNKFNTDEFNVVINWIKSIDMKEHSHFPNEDENYIKKYNAYERDAQFFHFLSNYIFDKVLLLLSYYLLNTITTFFVHMHYIF